MLRNKRHKTTLSVLEVVVALSFGVSALIQDVVFDRITVGFIVLTFIHQSRNQAFLINPFSLFVATPISLLVYSPLSHQYMLELGHRVYFLCILHFIFFYVTLRLGISVRKISKYNRVFEFSNQAKMTASTLVVGLGIVGLFISEVSSFSWILILFGLSVLHRVNNKLFLILFVLYLFIALSVFSISKLFLLNVLLFIAILFQKRRLTWKKSALYYIRMTVAGLVLLSAIFRFGNKDRGYTDAESSLNYYSSHGLDWSLSPELFLPYMYITTPWTNLQFVVDTQNERTHGLWLLKPVLGYIGLELGEILTLRSYSSFNTFTFIAVFFKDFGYLGSLVGTVLLAYLVIFVYRLYLSERSEITAGLYTVISLAEIQMYFSNHFVMQSYPVTALILFGILMVCLDRFEKYG